jgi:ribosome biogenesis GTP-binding protein YsxC/EngB
MRTQPQPSLTQHAHSRSPGKTQTINHFKVTSGNFGPWYLVDLPGYGFARAPGELKTNWTDFTMDYFLKRESLVSVLLLVDGSIPPQAIDLEVADWLGEHSVPFSVIFTKVDKRKKLHPGKRVDPTDNVRAFQGALAAGWRELPPSVMTSAATGAGRQDVLNHIAALRNFHRQRVGPLRVAPLRRAERAAEDEAAAAAASRRPGSGERAPRGEEEQPKEAFAHPGMRAAEASDAWDEPRALGGDVREAWEEAESEDDVVPPAGMPGAPRAADVLELPRRSAPQRPPPPEVSDARGPPPKRAPAAPRPPVGEPAGRRPSGRPVPGKGKAKEAPAETRGTRGGKPAAGKPAAAGGKPRTPASQQQSRR